MEVAIFSSLFGRTTGMSMLLAPIQAFVAVFVPAQSAAAHARPAVSPTVPVSATAQAYNTRVLAATKPVQTAVPAAPVHRLKIVRQFEAGASRSCSGRLVISGRMSDVCAELERLAG